MKTIKERTAKWLSLHIIINVVVFIGFVFGGTVNTDKIQEYIILKRTLLTLCFPVITVILNGLLPSSIKYILVFTRITNPLPGTRVFSKLMKKDIRINTSVLLKKYGELPITPNEQNILWYKLFKLHENEPSVYDSHRSFLLTRDITSMSVLMLILFSLGTIILVGLRESVFYISFLIAQYLITMISARNYGNRFALNVLASDSTTEL